MVSSAQRTDFMGYLHTHSLGLSGSSLLGIVVLLFVMTGCASTYPLPSSPPAEADPASDPRVSSEGNTPASWGRTPSADGEASSADRQPGEVVEAALRAEERRWHGVPYQWGGASPQGFDCSGFVTVVYRDLFDMAVPRTTMDQVRVGDAVAQDAIQAGDLVFFHPSEEKSRHVGIYLGEGEFAHASTSEGVTISSLDDPYWQSAYWTTRRLLPTAHTAIDLDRVVDPTAPDLRNMTKPTRSSTRRTGW